MKDPMTAATVTDPVCGMSIDPASAVGSSTYGGETYHFCSRGCETRFETAPDEYTRADSVAPASGSCCSAVRFPAEASPALPPACSCH